MLGRPVEEVEPVQLLPEITDRADVAEPGERAGARERVVGLERDVLADPLVPAVAQPHKHRPPHASGRGRPGERLQRDSVDPNA